MAPTITLTDTAVHEGKLSAVADKLYGECTREVLDFKALGLFTMLLTNVTVLCYELFGGDEGGSIYRPWRGESLPKN